MKASIYVMKEDSITVTRADSPMNGVRLPYLSRFAHPVFSLDSEQAEIIDCTTGMLDAPPGMVGISMRGGKLYVIDAEGNAQLAPFRVVTEREYERCRRLSESFRHETV